MAKEEQVVEEVAQEEQEATQTSEGLNINDLKLYVFNIKG